jgi:hypothetical protein
MSAALAIVIPTIIATLAVAFWFRASNAQARYLPDFEYSGRLELLVWSIPLMTVILVGGVAWVSSHDLDPRKPIATSVSPVTIQVVSLDWKWLFVYPDQGIASVNKLTIPVGTPVSFELTSSGVMNSFWVRSLAVRSTPWLEWSRAFTCRRTILGRTAGCRPISAATGLRTCASMSTRCLQLCAVGGRISRRWSGARRANLCRSGQAERGGQAFHLRCGRTEPVQ